MLLCFLFHQPGGSPGWCSFCAGATEADAQHTNGAFGLTEVEQSAFTQPYAWPSQGLPHKEPLICGAFLLFNNGVCALIYCELCVSRPLTYPLDGWETEMPITQCMQGDPLPACLAYNKAPECNITRSPICVNTLQLVTMNNALVVVAMHVQPLFHFP